MPYLRQQGAKGGAIGGRRPAESMTAAERRKGRPGGGSSPPGDDRTKRGLGDWTRAWHVAERLLEKTGLPRAWMRSMHRWGSRLSTTANPSSGYRAVLRNVCAAVRNSGTTVVARVEATMPCMRTYPCGSGSTT